MIPIIFGSLDFLYISFKYQNTFNKAMFKWFWTVFSLDSNSFIEWTWLSFETTRRLWSNLERSYIYLNIMPLLFRIFITQLAKEFFIRHDMSCESVWRASGIKSGCWNGRQRLTHVVHLHKLKRTCFHHPYMLL